MSNQKRLNERLLSIFLVLCMVFAIMPVTAFAAPENNAIGSAVIVSATLSYNVGETPQATAVPDYENDEFATNYYVYDEYWEEMEIGEGGRLTPVKYWHANATENAKVPENERITTFEADKTYIYSLTLKVIDEDADTFSDDFQMTLNGEAVSNVAVESNTVYAFGIKSITPTEQTQAKPVELITISNAVTAFYVGDTPAFTGQTPEEAPYYIEHEGWDAVTGDGGVTSSDYWNERYGDNLIASFAAEQYTYHVYLKLTDEAVAEGYCFNESTQLSINGQIIDVPDDDINMDGQVAWFSNVLTMTPSAHREAGSGTADFTIGDDAAALALLNAAKTGTEDSTWDAGTKTLTLRGIDFSTTADTAIKLPSGAVIVLADGTNNQIRGGDANVSVDGSSTPTVFGIHAMGDLTVKGETAGTGRLIVTSGNIVNSGTADTYSIGLYGEGNFIIAGGSTTVYGGSASVEGGNYAFSEGVALARYGNLSVTGGSLSAVGGETHDHDGIDFSRGIYVYNGDVTVFNNAVLEGKCVPSMNAGGLLANGIYILIGDLNVSDNAQVLAAAPYAIEVNAGNVNLSGGMISARSTGENGGTALSVETASYLTSGRPNQGNITVSGGDLELLDGGLFMYAYNPTDMQGKLLVTSGSIIAPSIYGPHLMDVEGGYIESGYVIADSLTLSDGMLFATEAIEPDAYSGVLSGSSAVFCRDNLNVSGGYLEAAWDWGENTPIVFSPDAYGYIPSLVSSANATITGGTVILDTGCGGNTALEAELTLGSSITQTGADESNKIQVNSDTPVVFSDVVRTNLTISGIEVKTKVYDATKDAELDTTNATILGVQSGDVISLNDDNVTAAFDSKNVGTDKAVSISGEFQLRGRDAYKYTLTQPTVGIKGSISPCTTVINTTRDVQNVVKGVGDFEPPIIRGFFGEPGSDGEIIETATGSLTYTIPGTSVTNGSRQEVIAYLKTLNIGATAEITYTFTGTGNYAGAKFEDRNGRMTDTAAIAIKVVGGCTITFDAGEGTVSPTSMITDNSGKLVQLPVPAREGDYSFDGWYTAPGAGTKITTDTVFTADTTVYAHWTKHIVPFSYEITEGKNGTWTQNSDGTLTFRANGDISGFIGVKVDGTTIAADKYTAVSGSTVVTLKNDYLATLSVGKHKLTVVYNDGECSTEFEVKAAGTNDTGAAASPQTGDNSNILLWLTVLFVSGAGLFGTTVFFRKKKRME